MYLGVQGGAIATSMVFSPEVTGTSDLIKSALLSGTGGLIFRYSGAKCCAIQLELNYTRQGWKEQHITGQYARTLHYTELPILTHIYFGSERVRGFVNLGPQIGYCIMETEQGIRQEGIQHQYAKIDNPFQWGLTGGLGLYGRSRKAGVFQLEARFNYALGSIFSNATTAYFSQSNAMALSLRLAYLYQLPNKKHKP